MTLLKVSITIICLSTLVNGSFAQGDNDIPLIEDFENQNEWPWTPWNTYSNGSSQKSNRSAHSGKYGLNAGSFFARTDKTFGISKHTISFWVRFMRPSRAYCGFGFQQDTSIGYFLCVDPSTNSFHLSRSPDYTYPMLKSKSQIYRLYVWYRVEIKYNSETNITCNLYQSDGVTLLNAFTCEMASLKPGGISFRGDGIESVNVDDIRAGTRMPADSIEKVFKVKKGEAIILKDILFETNKSILLPSSYVELNKLIRYLKNNPFNMLEISGYTDNTGNEDRNKILSLERAKAVADYLVKNGLNETKIAYKGYGSANPICSNQTEDGRNKNRRVEFVVH